MQHRGINLFRGCEIGAEESAKLVRRPGDHMGGNLQLADQRVCRSEHQRIGVHRGICTRCHDDLVLARRRHADQCYSGRAVGQDLQARKVHPVLAQHRECFCGRGIVADAGDELHIGAKPPRGQRLVGALAARKAAEGRAGNCFARFGQSRDRGRQVEVYRTDNDDFRHISLRSSRVSRSAGRRSRLRRPSRSS